MHTREEYREGGPTKRQPFAQMVSATLETSKDTYRVEVEFNMIMQVQKFQAGSLERLTVPFSAIKHVFEAVGRSYSREEIIDN